MALFDPHCSCGERLGKGAILLLLLVGHVRVEDALCNLEDAQLLGVCNEHPVESALQVSELCVSVLLYDALKDVRQGNVGGHTLQNPLSEAL